MPNALDHLTRAAMRARGYRHHAVQTEVGPVAALEWRDGGSLPPVVLLHGWASASVHHALTARRLRPHTRRVWLPDLPGHGFSAAPSQLTPAQTATGLQSALDELLDEPVFVVAGSLGGLAAVRYALARPDKVLGLVLTSPFGAPLPSAQLAELVALLRADDLASTKRFLDRLSRRPQRRNWVFAPSMRRILRRPSLQSLLDHVEALELLTEADLHRLQAPTTVVWGEHEALLPTTARDFWARGPGVELVAADGCGHSPSLDRPRWFAQLVVDRLKRWTQAVPSGRVVAI